MQEIERTKPQLSSYNTSSVDLNRSRDPTSWDAALLIYIYTYKCSTEEKKMILKIRNKIPYLPYFF